MTIPTDEIFSEKQYEEVMRRLREICGDNVEEAGHLFNLIEEYNKKNFEKIWDAAFKRAFGKKRK